MSKLVCPWWLGFGLIIPFRPLIHDPDRMLAPFVKPGMTVLDVGPGMGYFSLPMGRMVGPGGKVICVDVQEEMLHFLKRRAAAAHLGNRIVPRLCTPTSLSLDDFSGGIDFALAFAVVHEAPEPAALFDDVSRAMKPGALCLFAEPKGHVSKSQFEKSISIAGEKGLKVLSRERIRWSHAALLKKDS